MIVNGQPGPAFPSIVAGPVFSPDSQHVAFVVLDAGRATLVVDAATVGSPSTSETDFVGNLLFAPNNQRVAYVGINGGLAFEHGDTSRARRRVYVDGIAGPEYDVLVLYGPRFTPDSTHVFYAVGLSEGYVFVVVDGVEGRRYDDIYGSARLAPGGRSLGYTARVGRKFYLVTQPLEQTSTDASGAFSPGGAVGRGGPPMAVR